MCECGKNDEYDVCKECYPLSESSLNGLLPCPFCGGEATMMHTRKETNDLTLKQENSSESAFWVKCTTCQVSQWHYESVIGAEKAWNERQR